MKRWSLKVKVGLYAALLTMVALVAGVVVMMVTTYFYQISELDKSLHGDAVELVWDLKNFRDGPKNPREPLREELIPLDMRDHYLMIEGPEGQLLYKSSNIKHSNLTGKSGQVQTQDVDGYSSRVGTWQVDDYLIHLGEPLNVVERFQKMLGLGFMTALPAVGLVVFFGGVWLGRRAVAPVARLSAAAERISASNPQERLPAPGAKDEIAMLTEVLNQSFDRLQASYDIATRFSADASHQLKTPLTILRAGLDHLSRDTDMSEAQAAEVSLLTQQTRRLTSLIEDLLLLAQVDMGRMFLEAEEFDLRTLIHAASDDLLVLVEGKGISVEDELPAPLPVNADRRLIAMVLQNLIENAAKYTYLGGQIRITGFHESDWIVVRIANTSKDIPAVDREQIFERFRRGSGVGGNVRGHGLGLNIARGLIRAHGGEIRLNPTEPGWIEFEMRLPAG